MGIEFWQCLGVQSQVRLFADDTAVYLTVQGQADSKKLPNDLDIRQEWEWDMEFNHSKCQVVHMQTTYQY